MHVTALPPRLWATGRETLGERRRAEPSLGAQAGRIAARHTWSRTRVFHPHRPWLVSGGGSRTRGRGGPCGTGCCGPGGG